MSSDSQPESKEAGRRVLLAWAIGATAVALVSTGAAVFFYWHGLRPEGSREGWKRWEKSAGGNGHWYKAVAVGAAITWTEAENLAREQGGYLATITSEAENQFVFGVVNAPEFFTVEHGMGPALGGFQKDRAEEPAGGWGWITGEPWSYSNWLRGEPNNGRAPTGTEDRIQFYSGVPRTPAATWNDINRGDPSSKMISYVMERND